MRGLVIDMSRIGKKPIELLTGVKATLEESKLKIAGPKGELTIEVRPEVEVKIEDGNIVTFVKKETKDSSAYWGTTRALISNMVKGVTEGFEKTLKLVGVGYRVKKVSDSKISMTLGFSHSVEFEVPKGITLDVEGNDTIFVKGIDKQLVGLTAAKIRKIRKPEPYKGKGIRYEDEVVKRKPGKAGKVI